MVVWWRTRGAIEIVTVRKLPNPVHRRCAWDLFVQLGHQRLIGRDDRELIAGSTRVEQIPVVRTDSAPRSSRSWSRKVV